MKKGRSSKGKSIRPTFFIFCEGETEEAYVTYLRSVYRLPIQINAKISGSNITGKYISNYRSTKTVHSKDKTFLIYDCDVPDIIEKLRKIDKVVLLLSDPCFELWYLLHFHDQKTEISSDECIRKLSNHLKNYQKGILNDKLKCQLDKEQEKAITRSKALEQCKNPSTDIFQLIEELETLRVK